MPSRTALLSDQVSETLLPFRETLRVEAPPPGRHNVESHQSVIPVDSEDFGVRENHLADEVRVRLLVGREVVSAKQHWKVQVRNCVERIAVNY